MGINEELQTRLEKSDKAIGKSRAKAQSLELVVDCCRIVIQCFSGRLFPVKSANALELPPSWIPQPKRPRALTTPSLFSQTRHKICKPSVQLCWRRSVIAWPTMAN
jgi:hypothetical protein